MRRILVVNPNSSAEVTEGIAQALVPFGDRFEVTYLPNGPKTIRTDDDAAQAGQAFADLVRMRPDAAGFITACFFEPGLDLARAAVLQPVTGAQEAALLEATVRGDVLASSPFPPSPSRDTANGLRRLACCNTW